MIKSRFRFNFTAQMDVYKRSLVPFFRIPVNTVQTTEFALSNAEINGKRIPYVRTFWKRTESEYFKLKSLLDTMGFLNQYFKKQPEVLPIHLTIAISGFSGNHYYSLIPYLYPQIQQISVFAAHGQRLSVAETDILKVTNNPEKGGLLICECELLDWKESLEWQRNIITSLSPEEACLVFKLPYVAKTDMESYNYFRGKLIVRNYMPGNNNTTCLHYSTGDNIEYNVKVHDEMMFYVNSSLRRNKKWKTKVSDKVLNFDDCYALSIIEDYLNLMNRTDDPETYIKDICKLMNRKVYTIPARR